MSVAIQNEIFNSSPLDVSSNVLNFYSSPLDVISNVKFINSSPLDVSSNSKLSYLTTRCQ